MRQALEDLIEVIEAAISAGDWKVDGACEPTLALVRAKRALAQPETPYEIGQRIAKTGGGISHLWSAVLNDGEIAEAERGFKEALAQPEHTWVGLTWEEIDECFKITPDQYLPAQIYKRIEAKLKEKNT